MGNEHHHDHGQHHKSGRRAYHRDWRVWSVIIMLGALAIYVLSGDDMFGLKPRPAQAPPAAGTGTK